MQKGEGAFAFGNRSLGMFDRLLDIAALPMAAANTGKELPQPPPPQVD